ncbi:MAG: thiolase family protein [Actinomycetota bacterium]
MTARNPMKDRVAIIGVGSTGFTRSGDRSQLAMALAAATEAITDAGLTAADIDGIVATSEPGADGPEAIAAALGITEATHHTKPTPVVMFSLLDAARAVFTGAADHVLVVTPVVMGWWNSRRAASDPWRAGTGRGVLSVPEDAGKAAAYAAWAGRYIHEFGATKDPFARIAINSRTNAAANPLAAATEPLSFGMYDEARMVRDPLNVYDMDLPVDGADAFVLTTTERARELDLAHPPVLIHAATTGIVGKNHEDQLDGLHRTGQHVVVDQLRRTSDIWIDDIDLFYPYEGFTIITLTWFENVGFCPPGGAEDFLREHWNDDARRIEIHGRIPVNTHGGSLSEGATRGTGHIREAVHQLRGTAGPRQVDGAQSALVTPGGFFFNPQGAVLTRG